MTEKKRLIIIGAGGHGRVCAEIAELNGYDEISFLDDGSQSPDVIGKSMEWPRHINNSDIFIAIGNNTVRKSFFEDIMAAGGRIVTLIHPRSVISKNAILDKGTVVMAGAVIGTGSVIGKGSIINTCSSVDHDCIVSDYCHVSVGSHLAGTVNIGRCTMVGAGATVINNVNICPDCMIGAGAVVIKDIDKLGTYAGVPAKKIK